MSSKQIYGPSSRFVTPLISENYVRGLWPRFEFESALREERTRDSESILPIRIDDSRLPGLHDSRIYLSIRDNTIDEIIACIIAKCTAAQDSDTPRSRAKPGPRTKQSVAILSDEAKGVLGILVVSQVPLPLDFFAKLFPDVDWRSHIRALKKLGLLKGSNDNPKPSANAVKAIRSDEAEWKHHTDRWVKRLEELKEHSDIALFLAMNYMSERRWDDAVVLLADMANNALHGHTNQTYGSILEKFTLPKILRRLKPLSRIKLFHALAICSTQDDRYQDALDWFEKVRSESVRVGDSHWLGQYFINSGVALDLAGDIKRATTAFQEAIKHGEKHDEPSIVGRSLGNLAQIRMRDDDPDAAIELMRRSMEWKKKAGDNLGIAIASAQLGSIEANRGNLPEALEHFSQAESSFAQQGFTYEQAKTALNTGKACLESGQRGNALKAYRRAYRLAEEDEYLDIRLLAIQGIGTVSHALGRFDEIEREFNTFLQSSATANDSESRLTAYHGLGVSQVFQGKMEEGHANLKRALNLARKYDAIEWEVKALVGMAGHFDNGKFHLPAPSDLARLAALQARKQRLLTAASLWKMAGESFARFGEKTNSEAAFSSAVECYERGDVAPEIIINNLFKLYAWRWRLGFYEKALAALENVETLATTIRAEGDRAKAIDDRGFAFQRLGRIREALVLHQKSVRLARKHGLLTQLRFSLNNQGEALRRLGRFDEAIAAFQESEILSRSVGDIEDALTTKRNRGLALEESGDPRRAGTVLKQCRDEAQREGNPRQHVRALEALGNLAWRRGHFDDAENLYREGLKVARQKRIKDDETEIAVNLASLWEKNGKVKQALRLLQPLTPQFDQMPEPHVCHEILARLFHATGEKEAAKKHWQMGREAALIVGNNDYVAICSASLADLYFESRDYTSAEKELETAIENEPDTEPQVPLLVQLFRVQLALSNEERAQSLFQQINRVANQKQLHEVITDMHVHLGDYEWRGDKKSKLNALKVYLVAIVHTFSYLGYEAGPKLIGHIVLTLTNPSTVPTEAEFDSLLEDLRKVLPRSAKEKNRQFLLWPFETARRLVPFIGNKRRFEEEVRLAAKEIDVMMESGFR